MIPWPRSLAFVLVSAIAGCGAREPLTEPPLTERIDELVRRELEDEPAAGVSFAVLLRGHALAQGAYGLADMEAARPVTEQTRFQIGSITKQLTAALVMRLVEARTLSLEDDIGRWVAEARAQPITVRELLAHTAGLKDYTELAWYWQHAGEELTRTRMLAAIFGEPLEFAPGAGFHYSNSGYYVLGHLVEVATGRSYAALLDDEVVARAGLERTSYCGSSAGQGEDARGYRPAGVALVPAATISMSGPFASGALCSTASELVRFSAALARGDVVGAASRAKMMTPVRTGEGAVQPYGLGMSIGSSYGQPVYFHDGSIPGFSGHLAYYPIHDLHIAVLVNTEGGAAARLGTALARVVLGLPEPEEDTPLSDDSTRALIGRYALEEVALVVEVYLDAGKLYTRNEGEAKGARMRPLGDGRYVVGEDEATLSFELEGGRATALVLEQAGRTYHGQRVP